MKKNEVTRGSEFLDLDLRKQYEFPLIDDLNKIPKGDMPGDRIEINHTHIEKAKAIFPKLLALLNHKLKNNEKNKVVISIHGGSGVGKSEIGALISYYLNDMSIGSYVLSGDNYPYRIPKYNDAERLRIFRTAGILALSKNNLMTGKIKKIILELQKTDKDADINLTITNPWLSVYQSAGNKALKGYLGSTDEIDFAEISRIISCFKKGDQVIPLKRMGRSDAELWYDYVDMTHINVIVIEWTHGNNANLQGVDIPILLNSTPEETLEHRSMRHRDGGTDSAFTTMVLKIEQEMLDSQAKSAQIIVTKKGEVVSYEAYLYLIGEKNRDFGPMMNAYPDSIGGTLGNMVEFLSKPELKDVFSSLYVLPSIFNTDLDRGFSVIDYGINTLYAKQEDLIALNEKNISLKFDLILNHASVLSKEFQDILKNGQASKYMDFFINWNEFWDGYGTMTEDGYVQPEHKFIKNMFFRKPGLPLLNVRMPDGETVPFWNTFYQEVKYDELSVEAVIENSDIQYESAKVLITLVNESIKNGLLPNEINFNQFDKYRSIIIDLLESKRRYLGQMDLNIKSPLVWNFYDETLRKLSEYGAKIVRLDAFAYASKEPGEKNFFNQPGTWDLLSQINSVAKKYNLTLLPEIHSKYEEGVYEQIAEQGYMTYDFFLPGLIIDAFERRTFEVIKRWIQEIIDKKMRTVNMLGCHDGIPLLDLKGLLTDEQIEALIKIVVKRGGMVKDLHGQKNIYYQVNATYFSALGEDVKKMLLARAIQIFMPGKPQVWYLDLFAGKNDDEAVKKAGSGGHKEINRTNLSMDQVENSMKQEVVQEQLRLLQFRKTNPAFEANAKVVIKNTENDTMEICWNNNGNEAVLEADLKDFTYRIRSKEMKG